MNEEALNDAYKHFVDTGYDGTLEDYKVLIGSNPEALQDSFKFFTDTGYDGTIEDFSSLLGVKKKDSPDLPGTSQEDVVESVTETTVEEPISSDSLVSEELISKNEESVVPELQYLYPEFEFEETGFGNYVKITAPNKEVAEFGTGGTDNDAVGDVFGISDGTLEQRTKDIQDFINKNSVKAPSGLNKLENNIKEKEVKFYDKEQYDEYVESYQEDQEVLNLELKLYLKDYYGLQKEKNYFFSDDYKELKKTNPLLADQKLEDFKKREAENQSQQKVIKELQDKSTNQTIEYKKNVGRYIEKESEKGTWYGNILNSLTTGEGGREAGQVGIITDILSKILPFGGMAPEEFDANILEELISDKGSLAEGLGLDPESEEYKKIDPKGLFKNAKDLSYDQWRLSLSKDKLKELKDKAKGKDKNTYLRYAYMDEKYKGIDSKYINKIVTGLDDDLKGDLKSKVTNQGSKDVKATMLPIVRKQLTENFSRPFTGVTEEYSDAMKQTTVGGGVYGAFESVPALIGPGLIGKAANFGFIQTDAIFDEMSRDPSFDEVPESQKYLVTAPLAVVTGILEAYGFRNLTSGSTIVKSLTLKGLKKLGQGTGASKAKTFAEIIQREVKNDIARGTLRVGSAALAEAETGALQEVAEINAKRLWNAASSKGEFDTPEAWSSAYYGQVFKAGLQEAIGGVVLGLPTGISSAVNGPISQRGNSLNKMSDQMYELFLGTTNDKNYQRLRKAQVGMLKEQINAGEITKKEAQEQIDSYDQIVGLSKKINPDLPIQDQKEILSLLYEEQKLNEQLAGKDPRTMPEVKAALDDIQDTITKITDNAISKYQPKGVDVQEQTGDGQKVVKGDTTGAVTNQSQKETEGQTQNKETEVETESTLVAGQEQIREDISKPYLTGNTEVKFNPDGTVKEILKKGTKTIASKAAQSKAEKNVLKNKIDVNAGKIFTPSNDSTITPKQYTNEVAENSTNVRQIAEAIKQEKARVKGLSKNEQIEAIDPDGILGLQISEQDFVRFGDPSLITKQIRRNWFKKTKDGPVKNDIDTVVMEMPGYEVGVNDKEYVQKVIDFIVENPTRKISIQKGKPAVVKELETRFKELTGINPTPSNIDTVVAINPDATPLVDIQEQDKAQVKIAQEPTKNKKGVKNPKKILGKDKEKKVTVNEKTALKDQIKLEAKAAKEAKRSVITEQKLKRKRKIAKKNIGAKLGVISVDLDTALQTLFSIDPDLIPDKQLDSYADLVKEFGDSKKVLDLNDKAVTLEKAVDIINAVEMEVEVDEEGVLVKEEKIDNYDLNQEVKEIRANKITNEELNNIPDSRSREIAREISEFSKQDIDGLVKENKKGEKNYSLVNTLKAVKNNIKNGFVPKAALDVLTEVNSNKAKNKVAPKIKAVTKAGVYRHLRSFYNSAKVAITSNSPSGKNLLLDRLRSSPTFFIDDIFGNFNSKTIYDNTFKKLAVAYESFKTGVARAENKIKDADKLLSPGFLKGSRNKTVKAKYKLRILQLQREYLSNIVDGKANPKAPPALAFIDATMQAIKDGEALSPSDLKILQELRAEFLVDNEISLDKLNKSLTPKEKKALALYDEVSASTAEKAVFISSTLYGNRVNLLNDYTHHSVLTTDPDADLNLKSSKFVNSSTSTKAGTIVERTPGAKPISFDPSYSALRGVQETLLDYEMTQINREVAKTVNKIKSEIKADPNSTMAQNNAANALVKSLNEVNEVLFKNTFTDVSSGDAVLNRIKTLGYQASLASIPRAVAELAGNMGMMLKNPVASARAFKNFGGLTLDPRNTTLGMDIMDNLDSSETSKLFDTEAMQSKYSNMTDFMQSSQSTGNAVNPVQNAMGIILNLGVKQTAAGINTMANKLMSYPDQAISRPLWFGSFADSFAKATKELNGKEIKLTVEDYKKIGDGTSQYLTPEFKEARERAKNSADANAVTVATSTNPYNNILKNMPRTTDKGFFKPLYRQANSYMARFSLFEYGTARNAIGALYKSGDISKPQAAGLLSGVIFRMSSYVAVYSVLTSIMDEELFDAKDDKEEDFEDILTRQTVGSVLTLLTRGNLGNIPSIPINFLLETMVNEPYLGDLRNNKEYDAYKHSIVFSQLNKEDLQKKNLAEIGMKIFAGPYGPMLATALRTGKLAIRSQFNKTQESRDKNLEELTNRMAFEALGNSGLVPFYKDIRRALVKKRFNQPKPLTKTQLKELKKNYPEYFQDGGTSNSARSRKSRPTKSKKKSRPSRS